MKSLFGEIRDIVQRNDTKAGLAFDYVVLMIVLFAVSLIFVESLPGLSPYTKKALEYCQVAVVIIFTAEYVLRFSTAPKKSEYVFGFYGIVDLLAVLPFYLSMEALHLGADFSVVRAFRLMSIFRILKIARYNKALERFGKALSAVKAELGIFLLIVVMCICILGVSVYYFEHQAQPEKFRSAFDGLWWAICTLTTVTYGDIYPVTTGGKIFSSIVMVCGIGLVAIPLAIIAASLWKGFGEED